MCIKNHKKNDKNIIKALYCILFLHKKNLQKLFFFAINNYKYFLKIFMYYYYYYFKLK